MVFWLAENAPDEMERSGQCRPEQWLVHMNPNLDYSELSRTYPNISQRTFYRWKQEVRQVMDYMRDRPDVRYDDIASVLPEVSHEAFLMWQHLLTVEKLSQQSAGKTEAETTSQPRDSLPKPSNLLDDPSAESVLRSGSDAQSRDVLPSVSANPVMSEGAEQHIGMLGTEEEESASSKARRQTRDEFIHVMLNPAMDYAEFARRFGTVSQRTFYRWRAHIRDWRAAIRADPHLDYATFSRTARDVPESVFRVWRDWENRLENPHNTSTSYDSYEGTQHDSSQSSTGQTLHPQAARGAGSTPANSEVWKNCPPHASQLEVLCSAYDYYQRHPDIQFEGLAAQFPSVTADVFQQWKKGVDMKLEYIRSIPTTNFDDFHSLFPDVKEDIFDIWKAKVLSQAPSGENFLFPQSADSESSSPLPVTQPAYPTSSQSSHLFYPQTAAVYAGSSPSRHDDGSGSQYRLHATSGKSPLPSMYKSRSSHSPRLQSSPARTSEEVLDTEDARGVRVKVETSPNTPLPSFTETVSNLGRLLSLIHI